MLLSTTVTTSICMGSTLQLHGIAQTLMASTLVTPLTSPLLHQPLVQVMTVSPLEMAAKTYWFQM